MYFFLVPSMVLNNYLEFFKRCKKTEIIVCLFVVTGLVLLPAVANVEGDVCAATATSSIK